MITPTYYSFNTHTSKWVLYKDKTLQHYKCFSLTHKDTAHESITQAEGTRQFIWMYVCIQNVCLIKWAATNKTGLIVKSSITVSCATSLFLINGRDCLHLYLVKMFLKKKVLCAAFWETWWWVTACFCCLKMVGKKTTVLERMCSVCVKCFLRWMQSCMRGGWEKSSSVKTAFPPVSCITNWCFFYWQQFQECKKIICIRLYLDLSWPPYLPINLTSGIHKAQLTWTHLVPLRVGLRAPPLLGQSRHLGWTRRAQVRHSQFPWGTFRMP